MGINSNITQEFPQHLKSGDYCCHPANTIKASINLCEVILENPVKVAARLTEIINFLIKNYSSWQKIKLSNSNEKQNKQEYFLALDYATKLGLSYFNVFINLSCSSLFKIKILQNKIKCLKLKIVNWIKKYKNDTTLKEMVQISYVFFLGTCK